MSPYYVYVLQSEKDGSYYLGQAGNLEKRIERHQEGRSPHTESGRPWRLVYKEEFESRAEALRKEREYKSQESREFLEGLIRSASEATVA